MGSRRASGYGLRQMPDDPAFEELLRRPEVVAAIGELGVASLSVEDVLTALRRFGTVRIEVGEGRPAYTCVLEIPDEQPERAHGTSVLHAALACWAATLDSARRYTDGGLDELTRFLARADEDQDDAG